jgi:hypothetical protein
LARKIEREDKSDIRAQEAHEFGLDAPKREAKVDAREFEQAKKMLGLEHANDLELERLRQRGLASRAATKASAKAASESISSELRLFNEYKKELDEGNVWRPHMIQFTQELGKASVNQEHISFGDEARAVAEKILFGETFGVPGTEESEADEGGIIGLLKAAGRKVGVIGEKPLSQEQLLAAGGGDKGARPRAPASGLPFEKREAVIDAFLEATVEQGFLKITPFAEGNLLGHNRAAKRARQSEIFGAATGRIGGGAQDDFEAAFNTGASGR